VSEATSWLDEYGATATAEDFAEQREKLSDAAHPITSKLYQDSQGPGADGYDNDESGEFHDEL
jgi:heat shock protein 5